MQDFSPVDASETEKEIYVSNPLKHDFTWSYLGTPYTIRSMETLKFPEGLAHHLAKHIIDEMTGGKLGEKVRKDAEKLVYLE